MTTARQNPGDRVQHEQALFSATLLAMLLLLSGGCSLNDNPEDDLVFEPILPPVGLIFEYDISPDGQYAAVLMPTAAAEPGSDAYLRIAAWGADHLAIESNEVELYDFSSLQKIASFTIRAQDIRSLDWASDNSWLLVDTGPELLRLELADGSTEKLVDAVSSDRMYQDDPARKWMASACP